MVRGINTQIVCMRRIDTTWLLGNQHLKRKLVSTSKHGWITKQVCILNSIRSNINNINVQTTSMHAQYACYSRIDNNGRHHNVGAAVATTTGAAETATTGAVTTPRSSSVFTGIGDSIGTCMGGPAVATTTGAAVAATTGAAVVVTTGAAVAVTVVMVTVVVVVAATIALIGPTEQKHTHRLQFCSNAHRCTCVD